MSSFAPPWAEDGARVPLLGAYADRARGVPGGGAGTAALICLPGVRLAEIVASTTPFLPS